MDTRLQALTRWIHQHPGFDQAQLAPVSGDASFRRYFRATGLTGTDASSVIAMDAPPAHEDCRPFVAIARHWRNQGVSVPDILAQDLEQGFLLLEDFGDDLMLGQLTAQNADAIYRHAMAELCRIQHIQDHPDCPLPPYDTALLDREMALFPDWLITQQLGIELSSHDHCMLDSVFSFLRESALAQPEVTVHRDYHSRNLLMRPGNPVPGVIDFQDAVKGPVTYDLVSLLKDCYVRWPEERRGQWLEHYRTISREAGLHHADPDTFRQWFELMGMQRHLKAAGIFARLAIRDGKTGYLADIPRTVQYLVEASERQAALRHFHGWLVSVVVPRLATLAPATSEAGGN
ncbi:aminoglycoside phosphotransferase family protein [Marinobacter caseinilyticus]|uniref:aminoglycoside phosphotransferase family protein n=1 Tax=Marinobacter caseinilyticus TaxID=2692195 RepID=UPI001407A1F7|nr:phosphotransferase [Marinobacter caseinilyticus]